MNKKADLNFKLDIENKEDESLVWVSVNGIDGNLQELYPEVKIIREHPELRFAGLYRPFASPQNAALFQVMLDYSPSYQSKEKVIACDHAASHQLDLSDEEFKEIMYVVNAKKTRLQEALAFFQNHPDKLKDPDYQVFFKFLFLNDTVAQTSLLQEIQKHDTFSSYLATFIENAYKHYRAQNEIQTCAFLLQIAHQFSGYSPEQSFYKTSLTELRALLSKKSLEPEEKSVLYAELVAQLANQETLTDSEVEELLIGTVYLRQNPVISKWSDPSTERAVRDSVIVHHERIHDALKTQYGINELLLNRIVRAVYPSEKNQKWKLNQINDHFEFVSSDNRLRYAPLSRQLQAKNAETYLPLQIREHPYFRKFFSTIRRGVPCADNIYRFTDRKGVETLVKIVEDQLTIEQKRNGKWLKFFPAEEWIQQKDGKITSVLMSRQLAHHFTHWQDSADPTQLLIVDPQTNQTVYRAKIKDNQINEIYRLKDGARLGKPSSLFDHFEDPAYVHQWFDQSGKFIEVELPRFHLNFKMDKKGERLMCQQKKGYFLVPNAHVEALGVFEHYMVLKNDADKELILIPKQGFQAPEKKEVLESRYKINRQVALEDREKQTFLTYEINKKKQWVSSTTEAGLYLAQVLTLVQEYDTAAATLLKKGPKLNPYTEEEKKIIKNLLSLHQVTGDQSGNALALRSFAGYCLLHNSITYQKEIASDVLNLIYENYTKYLQHLSHATALHLEKSEEIFLLKVLLNHQFNPQMFVRLKQLDPTYAQTLTFQEEKATANEVQELDWNEIDLKEVKQKKAPDQEQILVTRPGKVIAEHLGYFFNVALHGAEKEKQMLRGYLPFMKYESGGKYLGLALLLEIVLDHPQDFTSPDHNLKKWKQETLDKARELYQETLLPVSPEKEVSIPKQAITEASSALKIESKKKKKGVVLKLTPTPLFSKASEAYFKKSSSLQGTNITAMQNMVKATLQDLPDDVDPLEKNEWERLEKDLQSYQSQPTLAIYQPKDKDSFKNLELAIKHRKKQIEAGLKKQEIEILALANQKPKSKFKKNLAKLEIWGGKRKVLTLEDLILYFGRKDPEAILKANPALSHDEVTVLMSSVGNYLLQATVGQQLSRAEGILNELLALSENEAENFKNLTQKLAAALPEARRHYDPAKNPAYLVFEYTANILLFPHQVKIIKDFLSGGEVNPVKEMIMGSGKSTILPLLGLLRADGKDLSMIIVPEPLFEDVASSTQKILGEAFAQKLKTLHFDRNTTFTSLRLQTILDELLTIQKEKQCLIMTNKSVKCLMLKYIEKYDEHFKQADPKKPFSDELQIMQKILTLLSSSGYPIIDEADTLLNILHETSFSMGEHKAPDPDEIQLISELYSLIYSDSTIKKLIKVESDPEADVKADNLTEKLYFEKCQRPLAEKFLHQFASIEFKTSNLKQKVIAFVKTLDAKQKNLVLDYLCRTPDQVKVSQAYYDGLDPDIQNLLALASEELCHLLPHTLLKNSDEKYGLDEEKEGIIAIPFAAVKTPSRGSQFANAYITMNYTFQIYAKKGISRKTIENEIKRLQGQAMKELKEGGTLLEATEAWMLFSSFKGNSKMTLFNYKEQELDQLVSSINSDLKSKQAFTQRIILPQLVLHDEKLSCNPLNMIPFLDKIIAFTGTLWNSKSMHRKLNPQSAAGTDGKTLCLLQKHSSSNAIIVKAKTTEGLLQELNDKSIQFNLLADSGGYCREWDNEKIAKHFAKQSNMPVIYYNKVGQRVETDGEKIILLSESKTPADKRKTYLDQSHTTGSDVPQAIDALGIVTVGENMLLRDLLQSVWRLRGLDKGQHVRFVVSEKVQSMINQELGKKEGEEITYIDILRFTIRNQAKQQGKDNFKALKKELRSLPQMLLLGALMHPDISIEQKWAIYHELRSTWIQSAAQKPRELFGKIAIKRDHTLVIEEEKNLFQSGLNTLFSNFPWLEDKGFNRDDLIENAESIIKRMENCLPHEVTSPESDDDNTAEVEQEQQTETEAQLETESVTEEKRTELGHYDLVWISEHVDKIDDRLFSKSKQPYFSLKLYFEQEESLKSYAQAFDGIDLMLNVLQWPKENPNVKDLQLFGPHRTPLQFVKLNNNGSVTLLSQMEVNGFVMPEHLYHLTNGLLEKANQFLLTPEMEEKIVKIKFLNGDSHYSKQEIDLLRDWFEEQGAEKMRTLYSKHILSGFPKKATDYQGSALESLFKKLVPTK